MALDEIYYGALDARDPMQRADDLGWAVRERAEWARLALAEIERPDGSTSWGVVVVLDEGYVERELASDMPEFYARLAARMSSRVQSATPAGVGPEGREVARGQAGSGASQPGPRLG